MKKYLSLFLGLYLLLSTTSCMGWITSGVVGGGGATAVSQEDVEDYIGNAATNGSGTQTLITVTYTDNGASTGWLNFVVSSDLHLYSWTNVNSTDLKVGSVTQAYNADLTTFVGGSLPTAFRTTLATTFGRVDATNTWAQTQTFSGGYSVPPNITPRAAFQDSDCPGTDKDVGNIEFAYISGADGAENAGVYIKGTEGGTEDTTWLQYTVAGGWVTTKKFDLGGAALEIPNAADPDLTIAGQISMDTDGANITGDVSIRGMDGTNQFMVARKIKTFTRTIVKPQDMADAVRDACYIWENRTGMTFTITEISCTSGTDDTTLNVEEVDADGQNNTTVDAVEIATNGTGIFTQTETTITHATIEAGHKIPIDFDDTDDPSFVMISISGWFDANVD